MVAAPFSMMRMPTAVDPVNEIRSTFGRDGQLLTDEVVGGGDDVEHAGGDVGLFRDQTTKPGGVPRSVRCGLENHRITGRQGLPKLVEDDLERKVPGGDRADNSGRLAYDLTGVRRALPVGYVRQGLSSRGNRR